MMMIADFICGKCLWCPQAGTLGSHSAFHTSCFMCPMIHIGEVALATLQRDSATLTTDDSVCSNMTKGTAVTGLSFPQQEQGNPNMNSNLCISLCLL